MNRKLTLVQFLTLVILMVFTIMFMMDMMLADFARGIQ